jgi:hypothetical protein
VSDLKNIYMKIFLMPAGMQSSQYFGGINENTAEAPPADIGKLIDKSEQGPYDSPFNLVRG